MKSSLSQYAFICQLIATWLLSGAMAIAAQPASTIEPGAIWPDQNGVHINAHGGGILLHDGVYYWFGEHKIAGPAGNTAQVGVHVYSSENLVSWKDEGIALKVADDPDNDIAKGCVLERPKVIYNAQTGKFVMWFHLELKGVGYRAARSGVAVAEQVTGPYQFVKSFRPNAGAWPLNASDEMKRELSSTEAQEVDRLELPGGPVPNYPLDKIFRRDFAGGQMARDMTLFVDDDKSAYHIFSSEENGCLHISQLTPDYLAPAGKYVRIFPGRFHEAPAMFKHNNKYYLITSGCTGWAPNAARSAVADSIWGPWRELGNPCVGSEEQVKVTFNSQATFVLPVPDNPNAFIFMADRWQPQNPIDGRYIWLPLRIVNGKPQIEWRDRWSLERLDKQVIILKLDDITTNDAKPGQPVSPRWQRVINFLEESKLKASCGIIGYSLETDNDAYFQWIKDLHAKGNIEFWNHGYRNRQATDKTGEFEGSLEQQIKALQDTQRLAKQKLDITLTVFGPHWSQTNAETGKALDAIPEIKAWFYGTPAESSKLAFERVLVLENPTFVPDFQRFKELYEQHATQKECLALQGHPNAWDDQRWAGFVKIIEFLRSRGCVFMTPSEYLARQAMPR